MKILVNIDLLGHLAVVQSLFGQPHMPRGPGEAMEFATW